MPAALVASNLEVMRGLRLMPTDMAACISRCPSLFVYNDFASEDFLGKLRFFREVLGRPVRQVLAKQPQLLMRSLSGMECKVRAWQRIGIPKAAGHARPILLHAQGWKARSKDR